jgi:YD repeat-containing protein
VWQFAYVGGTGQIDTVTIDGDAVDYAYAGGVTTRTDRNGNEHRYHFSGQQITQTDTVVASTPKYVTLYRYSGGFLANIVFPRGNRVDFTFDSVGNLTGRRHRTTDTATNDASDLVYAWSYNGASFMTNFTDPNGNSWTYGRDSYGNLTSTTNPTVTDPATQASSTSATYSGNGQIATYGTIACGKPGNCG